MKKKLIISFLLTILYCFLFFVFLLNIEIFGSGIIDTFYSPFLLLGMASEGEGNQTLGFVLLFIIYWIIFFIILNIISFIKRKIIKK